LSEKIADVVERWGDKHGEGSYFNRGRDDVGHHDDIKAGSAGGADPGMGILERVTGACCYSEAANGFEVDVGLRFATGDFVAADKNGEVTEETGLFEAQARVGGASGGGDGDGDFARGEVVEQFADAGFDGEALLLNVVFEKRVALMGSGFVVEAGAEGFAQEGDACLMCAADQGGEEVVGHGVAEKKSGFLPGDLGDAFGVEHEAVHVEDDAGVGGEVHERRTKNVEVRTGEGKFGARAGARFLGQVGGG